MSDDRDPIHRPMLVGATIFGLSVYLMPAVVFFELPAWVGSLSTTGATFGVGMFFGASLTASGFNDLKGPRWDDMRRSARPFLSIGTVLAVGSFLWFATIPVLPISFTQAVFGGWALLIVAVALCGVGVWIDTRWIPSRQEGTP